MVAEDMNVLDFARVISMIKKETPIADSFEEKYKKESDWWSCQREHLTIWCLHQPTLGVKYDKGIWRRKTPNNSAVKMYNKLSCPGTFLWLAEALGEEEELIQRVVEGITSCMDGSTPREGSKDICKKLREAFPFPRILELIQANEHIREGYGPFRIDEETGCLIPDLY